MAILGQTPLIPFMTSPCAACPWRKSNLEKPHPHKWYSKKNLLRLWNGLRKYDAPGMTCHPTDADNQVPDGTKPVPESVEKKECAGAIILVTRELRLLEKHKDYLKIRKGGLTRAGGAGWVERIIFGPGLPNLADEPDIQLPEGALK